MQSPKDGKPVSMDSYESLSKPVFEGIPDRQSFGALPGLMSPIPLRSKSRRENTVCLFKNRQGRTGMNIR